MLAVQADIGTIGPSLMPLVFAALLLDVAIIVVWYYVGVILQNSRVKESAKGEYYQFIGTVILVVLLLWGIVAYSSMATTIFGSTKLMAPSAISSLCTNIENTTQLNILSGGSGTPAAIQGGSFLYGYNTTSGNSVGGLCSMLNSTSLTNKIDYPLAATGVIIANLTNQTVANLNSTYTVDAFLGFLSSLKPTVTVCLSTPPAALPCFIPGFSSAYIAITATYSPYAGYNMLYSSLSSLGTLLTAATESYIAQIMVIWIILFIWPYLLFGGIVLRSTFFTRKIGGLLIAIALGAIIVFPTVYAIEYLTLGNGMPNIGVPSSVTALPENAIYGFNDITNIPQNTISGNFLIPSGVSTLLGTNFMAPNTVSGNYTLNFFVTPNLKKVAYSNSCWPGTIRNSEFWDGLYLMLPGASLSGIGQIASTVISGYPTFWLPYVCSPSNGLNMVLEMVDSFGIIGVTAYFLPIINLIITLTSIIGMSGLMGGDTRLEGLSRFV